MDLNVTQRRADFECRFGASAPPDDVAVEEVCVAGIPGLRLTPRGVAGGRGALRRHGNDHTRGSSRGLRSLLHLHGGGYAWGSSRSVRGLAGRIASAAGAQATTIDYRLAPEHPYPAALEDALSVYRSLLERSDPGALAIVGNSAGGGLAVATMLGARAARLPLPAAAVVMSPWVDLTATGGSRRARAVRDLVLSPELLAGLAAAYAGDADPAAPLLSPINADLSGLPPMLVQVGTREIIYDDAVRLARRARRAGVDATLEVAPGMTHVFQQHADLPEASAAIERIGGFLNARLL